jgi:hypothetical protein
MLAHAVLTGGERAVCAMRLHSFELDRHSVAESMGHTLCPIRCQVHSFYLKLDNGDQFLQIEIAFLKNRRQLN